jgi:hypothetical protein
MNDNEALFRRRIRELDRMREPIDGYERVATSRRVAIKLFREIEREIEKYVWENKPAYIYFTAGFDRSRFSLYRRLALKLGRIGYYYAEDTDRPNMLYCYKG